VCAGQPLQRLLWHSPGAPTASSSRRTVRCHHRTVRCHLGKEGHQSVDLLTVIVHYPMAHQTFRSAHRQESFEASKWRSQRLLGPIGAINGPLGSFNQYPSISRARQHSKTLRPCLLVFLLRSERQFWIVIVILCYCARFFGILVSVDALWFCVHCRKRVTPKRGGGWIRTSRTFTKLGHN
jgi:hypothetical protein